MRDLVEEAGSKLSGGSVSSNSICVGYLIERTKDSITTNEVWNITPFKTPVYQAERRCKQDSGTSAADELTTTGLHIAKRSSSSCSALSRV
jgi:hypothetical protein